MSIHLDREIGKHLVMDSIQDLVGWRVLLEQHRKPGAAIYHLIGGHLDGEAIPEPIVVFGPCRCEDCREFLGGGPVS